MAISTDEVTKIISNQFATPEEFAQVIGLLGGISARLKLEIQRDAAYRDITDLQTQLAAKQQELQQAVIAAGQEADMAVQTKQQEAAALQAKIDEINAQLPALLK